jgi:hypothetical protein
MGVGYKTVGDYRISMCSVFPMLIRIFKKIKAVHYVPYISQQIYDLDPDPVGAETFSRIRIRI